MSDDAKSRTAAGDLGYRTFDELETEYSRPIAVAAFALQEAGQVSGLIETSSGLFLLKLEARKAGIDRAFEEVRSQIAARLGRERRSRDLDALVAKLRTAAEIEIVESELSKLAVSPPTPSILPAGGGEDPSARP